MRRFASAAVRALALMVMLLGGTAMAQRHSFGSAPPTAPAAAPPKTVAPAPVVRQPAAPATHTAAAASGPIAAVSTGLGAIQYTAANSQVPAPQTLTRQLLAGDERTRMGALSSIGAPGEYLAHGHVPLAHSVQLDMAQLGGSEELDALLTVELDQHVVSAVMIPDGSGWRRIATLSFASSFSAGNATPSGFARPVRSWLEPDRYRAVFHASVNGANGDFTENEADLRVINGRAAVVISFVSGARQCDATGQLRPPHQTCELIQRWLEPDAADPTHRLTMITGTGHISAHEADDPLSRSRNYRLTRLRSFACQPLVYAEGPAHFEPVANSAPCAVHDGSGGSQHGVAEHAGAAEHGVAEHGTAEHGTAEHGGPDHGTAEHGDHP